MDAAIAEGRTLGQSAERVLVEAGTITSDQLARATAQRFGLWHVDLTRFKADLAALGLISSQAARRRNAAPIGIDEHDRLVAVSDPSNVLAVDDLKLMTGHEVRPVVGSSDDIQALIGRMSRLDDAVAEAVQQGEEEIADDTEIRESADDAPGHQAGQLDHRAGRRGARVGHPLRAGRAGHARAFPGGRRAARDDADPTPHGRRRRLPGEDHRGPRHRGEATAAGRPRVAHRRGPRDRHSHRHDAARRRRGDRHAHPRQVGGAPSGSTSSACRSPAPRCSPRHSSNSRRRARLRARPARANRRQRLRRAQRDQRARAQHHHHRGPGGIPARRRQPAR